MVNKEGMIKLEYHYFSKPSKWMGWGHDHDDYNITERQLDFLCLLVQHTWRSLTKKATQSRYNQACTSKHQFTVYMGMKRCDQQKLAWKRKKPWNRTWYLKPKCSRGEVKDTEKLNKTEETNQSTATYNLCRSWQQTHNHILGNNQCNRHTHWLDIP